LRTFCHPLDAQIRDNLAPDVFQLRIGSGMKLNCFIRKIFLKLDADLDVSLLDPSRLWGRRAAPGVRRKQYSCWTMNGGPQTSRSRKIIRQRIFVIGNFD
jgi:hypothetical protein